MTLSDPATSSSPNNSFTTKQSFEKATATAKKNLLKAEEEEKEKLH